MKASVEDVINVKERENAVVAQVNDRDLNESWTCSVCKVKFVDDDDHILECDGGCGQYFCAKCIELPVEQYETLQRPDCFWFCPECVLEQNKQQQKLEGDRTIKMQSKFMEDMDTKFNDLEEIGIENEYLCKRCTRKGFKDMEKEE